MTMSSVRIFTGRLAISVDDDFHEVELYVPEKKLKKGRGYIHEGFVYIYRGRYDAAKKNDLKPGLYSGGEHGSYVFIHPEKTDDIAMYSVDNIGELNIDSIFEQLSTNGDSFMDPEDIEAINNNSDAFVPTFKEDDDFLKYLIKQILLLKKVNLKNYKGRMDNQYSLNNMKSGLNKETKMTVTNFAKWMEILGTKWEMTIKDSGEDKVSPLPEEIKITSDDF